ncbi:MAG: hypothetical protein ACI4PC_05245 [Oscillospiraceae bacterium]
MKNAKTVLLLFAAVMLSFCGCKADAQPGSPAAEPSPTAEVTPAVPAEPLLRAGDEIESASIVLDGAAYALSRQEIETISALTEGVETECVPEPTHLQGQFSDPVFTLDYVFTDGSRDSVYATETGTTFFRYTDSYGPGGDRGYVLAASAQLGEYLTGLRDGLFSPALSPAEIVRGEVSTGTETAPVVHLEDISRRAAELIASGALAPYKEREFSSRMKGLTGSSVTVTLFNAAGDACASFTEDALGVYLTVGSHPYRVSDETGAAAVSLLIQNAPQSVYLDRNDPAEYVFSNGLALFMSYEEVIDLMGKPDRVEAHRPEQAACVYYGLVYGGGTVLFLLSDSTPEAGSLVCAQLFGHDLTTARDVAPSDDRAAVSAAYGMEIRDDDGTLAFYYPALSDSGDTPFDGVFSLRSQGQTEGDRLLLFLFSGDTLASVLLRPAAALDSFPPLCVSPDSAEMQAYWGR